ncbi:MAG: multifunctional CCA addition/repair protein [Plesiomonas shigelloides]
MQTYLVGGAVRDQLLGLNATEHDWVVVGATPEQLLAQGYQQVGRDFPVFLHPRTHEEYALARTERKQGQGYTGFVCHAAPDVTLEQDLLRRDLTINAIAQAEDGSLTDPYGGQQDLRDRWLRHVSPAFSEDPLRVLRVARFAARFAHLGFRVAPETLALMQQISASGELTHLTAERVWKETEKALNSATPDVYFAVLRACGALTVLFPELDNLFGVPAPEKWHPEIDSGIHTLMALQQAAQRAYGPEVRFAVLCHDFGKALTPPQFWPSHHGHGEKGVPLIREFCRRLKVPASHQEAAILVAQTHGNLHNAFALRAETVLKIFDQLDVWRRPERLQWALEAAQADFCGRLGFEQRAYPQAAYLQTLYQAALSVDVKAIVAQGLRGPEIKHAVQQQRQQLIAAAKEAYPQPE